MKTGYDPARYWERRYRDGRSSGAGSEGAEAAYKASVVNELIEGVASVVDWGVGDGTVLAQVNTSGLHAYYGLDVSETIIRKVSKEQAAPNRHFHHLTDGVGGVLAEMSMSLDVLFHFPDEDDYHRYLENLMGSATTYVLIYSTDYGPERTSRHVMRRHFTADIERLYPDWVLARQDNGGFDASFYLYEKVS